MKTILSILLIVIACEAVSQKQADTTINPTSIEFINTTIARNSKIRLYVKMNPYSLLEIKKFIKDTLVNRASNDEKVAVDTLIFSDTERYYIDSCLAALTNFSWNKKMVRDIQFKKIELITIDPTARRKFEGTTLYNIVPPIFLRNKTICLFNYSYTCGNLCGTGEMVVYKRKKDVWEMWMGIIWTS